MATASPLLTAAEFNLMQKARDAGSSSAQCSLDLRRSVSAVDLGTNDWGWAGGRFPYPERLKDRTVYYWEGTAFEPVARYHGSLIKLVPTDWGPPTFEIDGIKMLPTAHVSPYADAERKVDLIEPKGKTILTPAAASATSPPGASRDKQGECSPTRKSGCDVAQELESLVSRTVGVATAHAAGCQRGHCGTGGEFYGRHSSRPTAFRNCGENCILKASTTSWREYSSAVGNYSTIPARRTG